MVVIKWRYDPRTCWTIKAIVSDTALHITHFFQNGCIFESITSFFARSTVWKAVWVCRQTRKEWIKKNNGWRGLQHLPMAMASCTDCKWRASLWGLFSNLTMDCHCSSLLWFRYKCQLYCSEEIYLWWLGKPRKYPRIPILKWLQWCRGKQTYNSILPPK